MYRFTGSQDKTEILSETVLNTIQSINHLMILKKNPFENIVGKGENAGNQQISNVFFLLFSNNYTTQNLLRITYSFNDLMLKTNRLKKDFFCKDRLIFGLDDPVANMSIRHVYYA